MSVSFLLNIRKTLPITSKVTFVLKHYAKANENVNMVGGVLKKKKLGKIGPIVEKKVLPVETDTNRLVNVVCGSNIYKTGEDVAVRPDNEYPEWLWSLRTGPAPPLEELDPESEAYWRRIKKMAMRRNNKLSKLKQF